MRQEEREVDGPDLEQAEERKRETELVEEKEDELHDLDGLPETTLDQERSAAVLAAMKTILAGEQIVINDLKLPKRHLIALESLKAAVEGKDARLSMFVYAEDRRALLEQALAVLQPELVSMLGGDELKNMIDKVGELREKLNVLEDSEEELVEGRFKDSVIDESDSGDKDDDDDLDDKKQASGQKKPKKKGQKTGEKDDKDEQQDLSLDGPERPAPPKGPSTLDGPDRKEAPKGPSTLDGPERKAEPKAPTTVGDLSEIEAIAAATTPRWRRNGG